MEIKNLTLYELTYLKLFLKMEIEKNEDYDPFRNDKISIFTKIEDTLKKYD